MRNGSQNVPWTKGDSRPRATPCVFSADMSVAAGLRNAADAGAYVACMVEAGEICATIDSATGTVLFRETQQSPQSAVALRLENDARSLRAVSDRVRDLQKKLLTSPLFIQKVS